MKLSTAKNLLFGCLVLLFFGAIYKVLIPYGDEPDFEIRVERVQGSSLSKLIELPTINIESLCQDLNPIDRRDFFHSISLQCLYENISKSFLPRIFFGFLFIFLASILVLIISSKTKNYINDKVFVLSILFPFNIYILSSYSEEILSNLLSIILFCGLSGPIFLVGMAILFILDYDGQFLIIFTFLFLNYCYTKFKYNYTIFFNIILFALLFNQHLVNYIILVAPEMYVLKIEQMLNSSEFYRDKYGLFERLLICIGSLSFMTAGGIKIYLQNLYLIYKFNYLLKLIKIAKIEILSFISLLAIFLSLFPTHSYGKYYIFIIPIIFHKALLLFDYKNLFKINIILNTLISLNLILYLFI